MSILSNLLFYLVDMCLQKLIFISSIANLGYRTPSWQCRRGDEAADKIAVYRVKVFLFELF